MFDAVRALVAVIERLGAEDVSRGNCPTGIEAPYQTGSQCLSRLSVLESVLNVAYLYNEVVDEAYSYNLAKMHKAASCHNAQDEQDA